MLVIGKDRERAVHPTACVTAPSFPTQSALITPTNHRTTSNAQESRGHHRHHPPIRPGPPWLRARTRRARTQPEERQPRHPARRAGRLYRRLRLRQILARLRHPVRRSPAPLPGVGLALRAPPVPPDAGARSRRDRWPAASRGPAAAARFAHHALVGRQRQHPVELPAHAVLARRRLPRRPGTPVRRVLLPEYARRRLPRVLGPGPRVRSDRTINGARRYAHDPRAGDCRLAAGLARPEFARHPGDHGLRRRHALARLAEERPRLDPVHRRNADRAGLRRPHARGNEARPEAQGPAQLPGHLHRREALCDADLRHHRKRLDEEARGALHGEHRMPAVPRQAPAPGSLVGDVCRR